MAKRPLSIEEMNKVRAKEKDLVKIENKSKQMIPVHVKAGKSNDFFLSENTIKLMPGKTSEIIPTSRLNMGQVNNLCKKGMLKVVKL